MQTTLYIAIAAVIAFFAGLLLTLARANHSLRVDEDALIMRRALAAAAGRDQAAEDAARKVEVVDEDSLSEIELDLLQAGIADTKGEWLAKVYGSSAAVFLAVAAAGALSGVPMTAGLMLIAALAGCATALAFKMYVAKRKERNALLLEKQVAELELQIAENARSGLTVTRSLLTCTQEAAEPLRRHLARVYNEVTYGDRSLSEAMRGMYARCGSEDVHMLAVSVSIHEQTGASLADALTFLHDGIDAKIRMRSYMRSSLAQTKLTRNIVAVVPWGLFLMLSFAPFLAIDGFWDFYTTNPLGWAVLAVCVAAEAALLKAMDRIGRVNMD